MEHLLEHPVNTVFKLFRGFFSMDNKALSVQNQVILV